MNNKKLTTKQKGLKIRDGNKNFHLEFLKTVMQ